MCCRDIHATFILEYIIPFCGQRQPNWPRYGHKDKTVKHINDIPAGQYILVPKAIEQLSGFAIASP